MNRYRVDNLHTGEYKYTEADSRKAAHEWGCALWPGVPVTVHTELEYADTIVWAGQHNQLMDWCDGVGGAISDGDYAEARRCVEAAIMSLVAMKNRFERRG